MRVRYNPPQRMIFRTRLLVAAAALALLLPGAHAANWEEPVATLARQIAALAGPGPVQLTVSNRSSLSADEIPQIRQMLVHDLRAYGVVSGGSNSATLIHVTFSENMRGGLWVAEVQEGTETRVTMLPVKLEATSAASSAQTLTLQRAILITEPGPVLDAQVFSAGGVQQLVVLEPGQIVTYERSSASLTSAVSTSTLWIKEQTLTIPNKSTISRDMRGRIIAAQDHLFDAYLPGVLCRGTNNGSTAALSCANSDDPWPVTPTQEAFYDSGRNYFMGVLVPGFGMQLPPFYDAAAIPRSSGSATLLNNVNGSAVLIQNNLTVPINGTDDWGSDLTAIHSVCGSGTQVIVSGSGQAATGDSLRAYEIPGREAIPVSAPLLVPGTITAIWPSNSGNSAIVVVHMPTSDGYEVWSVTASCN
jgi:hypothetical protein